MPAFLRRTPFAGLLAVLLLFGMVPAQADTISLFPASSLPSGTEGITLASVFLGSFTSTDGSLGTADFSSLINWGDSELSLATIAQDPISGFDIYGNHAYIDEGTYTVSFSVNSNQGVTANGNVTTTIADAPLTGSSTSFGAHQGTPFSGSVGSFHDGLFFALATDFTATINWGDSTVSPGTVVSLGGNNFGVNGTHTYATDGNYNATVAIQDAGGSSTTLSDSVSVTPEPAAWLLAASGLLAGALCLRRRA